MFFGFNTFDPRHSPAVSSHQESYRSGFTSSALGYVPPLLTEYRLCGGATALKLYAACRLKKSKYAGEGKHLANAMHIFDESFGSAKH